MLKQSLVGVLFLASLVFSGCGADQEMLSVEIRNHLENDLRMKLFLDEKPVIETKHINPMEEDSEVLGEYFILFLFPSSGDSILRVESTSLIPGDGPNELVTESFDLKEALDSSGGIILTHDDSGLTMEVVKEWEGSSEL